MAKKNPNEFLMDLTVETMVGPRRIKVVVLNETDKAVVYIPLKAMTRVDYNRLQEIYNNAELDMLTTLRDHKLDNGRNALIVYKNIIGVYNKEPMKTDPSTSERDTVQEPVQTTTSEKTEEPPKPPRRKPGPKPKNKAPE